MGDIDYTYFGHYNLATFNARFIEKFSKAPRFNISALSDMSTLVDMIARDPFIIDIRWGAYMLATVMWETTSLSSVEVPVKNKKGQPIIKNGKPVTVKQKKWLMTMAPVDEVGHGQGRRYHEPVKVKVGDDGSVRVTEQDGDQFSVSQNGAIKPLTKGAKMGTTDGGAAVKTYNDDPGNENAYFGRGYVQLTWWSNYAKAGVALGRGLDLLLDPELVKEPKIAYALMSHAMRTGSGFANGHKFSEFFSGKNRQYKGARKMVNGTDHAEDIAKLAEAFEEILLDSRMPIRVPPPISDEIEGSPRGGLR
jgi:glycosyl hydrolase family 19 (putative chitinase)